MPVAVPVCVGDEFAHVGCWSFAPGSTHEEALRTSATILHVPDLAACAHNALLATPPGSFGADALQHT